MATLSDFAFAEYPRDPVSQLPRTLGWLKDVKAPSLCPLCFLLAHLPTGRRLGQHGWLTEGTLMAHDATETSGKEGFSMFQPDSVH